MKYDTEFKLNCIKIGHCSIGDAAKQREIPKQTLARWIRVYNKSGIEGLENKKPGVKEKPVDPTVEANLLRLWAEKKRSPYRMRLDLLKIDCPSSKSQIIKVYKKHSLYYHSSVALVTLI